MNETDQTHKKKKESKVLKAFEIVGLILGFLLLALLTAHSMLSVFKDDYYPTFGKYRLFSIVSDSMEPCIPTGSVIVCTVPDDESQITAGTVITFAVKFGDKSTLYTHRVTDIRVSETGAVSYVTKGDNAQSADGFHPRFADVKGVYTDKKCGVLGYIFGFIQSTEGAIALVVITLMCVFAYAVVRFINLVNTWRKIALDALEKSREMLARTESEQSETIADVIGIVSKDPKDKADLKRKDKKLDKFIRTGSLPERPYVDDIDDDSAE